MIVNAIYESVKGAGIGTLSGLYFGGLAGIAAGGYSAYLIGESVKMPEVAQKTLEVILAVPLVPIEAGIGAAAGAMGGLFLGGAVGVLYGIGKSIMGRGF